MEQFVSFVFCGRALRNILTSKGEEFLAMYDAFRSASSILKADLENLRSEAQLLEHMCKLEDDSGRGCGRSRFAVLG